jgi:hypothetical protein
VTCALQKKRPMLSIFLRQRGSPESKPVDSPHQETEHVWPRGSDWQIEAQGGSSGRFALDINETPVAFDNSVNHGKPKSGPFTLAFRRKERLEDSIPNGFVDPFTRIGNFD